MKGFRKYQKVERANVLNKAGHSEVQRFLHRIGKTSAADLTDEEREELGKLTRPIQSDTV